MHKYRLVAKKGEGTFSEVLKAQCIKNGKYVAIKCMKNHFDSLDQVNNLREIQALRRLSPHTHIIKLLEVLYDQPTGRLALVFELMDMNIYELIRGRRHYVAEDRVKNYMYQLMKAMDHMHRNGIFHRDIKPENILIMDDCLKLADFGSCRGIYSKQPYTEYISTRWYRAPECLLTDGYYNYKMDMWGVGCVFFEIMSLFPLFPGTNELDQIQKIHNILGTPPPDLLAKMKKRSQHMDFNFPPKEGTGVAKLIPHVPPDCVDLIVKLLAYNPDDRLSARQALRHPYFRELRDAEKRQRALLNPEASVLSAQPSTASLLGVGGQPGHQADEPKSARYATMSPAGSVGNTGGPHTLPHVTSPGPEGTSITEVIAGLPSIGKPVPTHTYSHPPQLHAQHTHNHAHTLPHNGSHGGALGGGGGHHAAAQQGHDHANHHNHGHHRAQQLDTQDEGPLEVSNSAYRLHAESSMDAVHSETGLPPIGNLSLGKFGQKRTLPNYYDTPHSHQSVGYGRGKAGSIASKRTVVQHKYGGGANKSAGVPAGVIGQSTGMPHKAAAGDVASNPGVAGYKNYKSQAVKTAPKPYVSPYSMRGLAKE